MYQILSIDMSDATVSKAVEALMNDTQITLPKTNGNLQLITNNSICSHGGEEGPDIIAIVGHGSPNGVSSQSTWKKYLSQLYNPPQANPASVFVVACATSAEGSLFAYGNFAQSVRDYYPNTTTVWASYENVSVPNLEGDWRKL